MNKIIEIAHMLGVEISHSDEIKNLEIAKDEFDKNRELQSLMSEYETERHLLAEEFSKSKDESDEKAIADLRARIDELVETISKNEVYTKFSEAQNAVNKIMTEVNAEIKFCITGERDDCTHDCSTCAGCH